MKNNFHRYKVKYALLAAVMAAAGICLMLSHAGYYPFGTDSILRIDLGTQYTDFLLFFKNSSFAEKLYSFKKGFGGPTIGFLSYYSLSAFNFIAFLFADRNVETAVFFIILAKFVFMAVSAYVYFANHYDEQPLNVAFALAYAFFPFFTRLYYHILWFDCFGLLPLLVLGCEKIIENKDSRMFTVLFCYALVSNYYIAYMCGIFILLYFVRYVFVKKFTLTETAVSVKDMALSVMTAVCFAAPVLLPSVAQLMAGKLSGTNTALESGAMFSLPVGLATLFDGYAVYKVPQLAGGVVFLLLMAFCFGRRDIPFREKSADLIFYGFMLLSFYNSHLFYMWHGFAEPMDFPYRHSFAYAFFLLIICRKAVHNITLKKIALPAVVSVSAVALVAIFLKSNNTSFSAYTQFMAALGICIPIVAIMLIAVNRKEGTVILSAVIAVTAVLNGAVYMKWEKQLYEGIYPSLPAGEYRQNYLAVSSALENTEKDGFYRVADITGRPYNQPMGVGYFGTDHYSSTFDRDQKQMFIHFGYQDTFYSTIYNHSDVLTDSLLGIKYLMSSDENSYSSAYYPVSTGERNLYSNPFALPVLFTGRTNIVEYSQDYRQHIENMFSALTGKHILNYDKSINYRVLADASDLLQSAQADIKANNGALIKAEAEGNYMLSTVIYDENWHIKVNGKSVKPEKFMEHFLSFPLEDGVCNIEMIYIPRGFAQGCAAFAVAAVLLSAKYLKHKKERGE